uniref:Nucleolar protein 11 n=1 Tax=Periophthalmus magnuspinnatus TaxID=409849 RepID=A0A3B3ZD70_9GOBI
MAALYEGYTLCGLVPAQNLTSSGVHGIKSERDDDHVLVTDSARSVTLYKVSDQKPLCSWTVKQGRSLTCPVVYNSITKEYVAVSDNKVIQIWKEDDISLDKAFKATLSSDVWQVHIFCSGEQELYVALSAFMSASRQTHDIFCILQTEPVEKVQQEVGAFISSSNTTDLQLVAGRLASALVSRSLADLTFYTGGLLSQLVQSRNLCYSICPDLLLLALEKRDYFLCQLCLQFFPDIPEAITCACLKAFISMTDSDANILNLDPASVSFMDMLITKDNAQDGSQNGCSYTSVKNDSLEIMDGAVPKENTQTPLEETCPVSLNKAVLLNEILQASYSENCLLPHLKDLSSQHALVFLQYLQFLYLKYSQDAFPQRKELRSPTLNQVMDWVCMVLDTHFTVLVMTPEAKGLLFKLHTFVKSQVKLFSELGKIGSSLQEINKMKAKKEIGQYSIEIIELY